MKPAVLVVAGVIQRSGRVLLARRPLHKPQGGLWEFPGGKLHPGELPIDALRRELSEELGIEIEDASQLFAAEHNYGDFSVELMFFCVEAFNGEPTGMEGQELRWVAIDKLDSYAFPEANLGMVAYLAESANPR